MTRRPPLELIEGGAGVIRLGPALELAGLGGALTATVALMARLPSWFHGLGAFQSLYAVAFAFYGLALLGLRRSATVPRVGWMVFAVALATRAALLPVAPSLSGDVHRYVWEGRVVAHGGDPYARAPLDPALAPLRDREIFPNVNHPELATIYPPLAIAEFAMVAAIAPTVTAMKTWVILNDLALVLLLLAWMRRRGESPAAVIAYAWNPLVLVEYAGQGHYEPLALLPLVLAVVLLERRPVISALALAAGVLIKLFPLLALPFLFPRWPARARAVAVVTLVLGLGAFWALTRGEHSGLIAYWRTWRNNDLVFAVLERMLGGFARARFMALAIVAAVVAVLAWRRWAPEAASRTALRTALVVSPVVHPWYLGSVLALEPLGPSLPWILFSFTVILNYGLLATPAEGRSFHPPLAWRAIEYGVPLAAGLLAARRSRRVPLGPSPVRTVDVP
jgi:hypothetical protein